MRINFYNQTTFEEALQSSLNELRDKDVIHRLLAKDHTLWKEKDEEITNRLGWLDSPVKVRPLIPEYLNEAENIRRSGIKQIVLLGMGGSSLAPQAISKIFPSKISYPELLVLDSTCPSTVRRYANLTDNKETLFLISSKSGTTTETLSLFSYFYHQQKKIHGSKVGQHFVAITDTGTILEKLANDLDFRKIIHGFPDVGGRFSALSPFGLYPAALIGIDLEKFLASGETSFQQLIANPYEHPGIKLGIFLGTLASLGKNKITLLLPSLLKSFGRWLEQLIAESTGKEGKGLLPVIENLPLSEDNYRDDRIFVFYDLQEQKDIFRQEKLKKLVDLQLPLIHFNFSAEELASHFYLWEIAIALVGYFLRINPFDQPDVELTKKKTRELLQRNSVAYSSKELLEIGNESFFQQLKLFLANKNGQSDYLSLLAFLPPEDNLDVALDNLARQLSQKTGLPCTWNYGPAYLHSTGQLHKGDAGKGKFIGLLFQEKEELPIPSLPQLPAVASSFNQLFEAQALGDLSALKEKNRKVIFINIKEKPVENIFILSEVIRNYSEIR